jgi:ferredoxin
MMHVEADQDLCCASARCVQVAPTVFDQDEDGLVVVLVDHPEDSIQHAVLTAARQCPTRAITVTG